MFKLIKGFSESIVGETRVKSPYGMKDTGLGKG